MFSPFYQKKFPFKDTKNMRVTCKTCHGTLEECECAYKSTDAVAYNQYVSMPGR